MTTAATITACTDTDRDTLLSDLRAAMLAHDWNYQMSDDYSAYRAGVRTAEAIGTARRRCVAAGLTVEAQAVIAAVHAERAARKRY